MLVCGSQGTACEVPEGELVLVQANICDKKLK